MSLCPACSRISVPNLTRELELHHLPPWLCDLRGKPNKPRGMVHLNDARNLITEASGGCPFCHLIVQAALQEINVVANTCSSSSTADQLSPKTLAQDVQQLQKHLVQQPIYLVTNYDPIKSAFPDEGAPGSWHIRGVKVFVPVHHLVVVVGRIRLYAARDSVAGVSCDIIGRPPLLSSDSPEAFDLIQRWMNTCLNKHQACRQSLSGITIDESTPPLLPSRVLHVSQAEPEPAVRLLETAGGRGHYVALSHCWGSSHHHPLMTTHLSLPVHLRGIAWDSLPKAYRDVIQATQRLGFEYIWIDSLCIIQDSHADWLSESQRMGGVYQHARLTIATSHATNSSETCFYTRPPHPPTVELPNMNTRRQMAGSIFAHVLSNNYDPIAPEAGPLAQRAWATQEWLLSRRMIFYTIGSLVWSCKTVSQRETGASFHSTARNPRWKNLVEKYSARQLTKQTDRLVALEGIRTEMAKKRGNDIYCYGMWKNGMPDQLLWYCTQVGERSKTELDVPTWTWASILQGVCFLNTEGAKNVCDGFRFDGSAKTLTIRSVVQNVPILTTVNGMFDHTLATDNAPFGIVWIDSFFPIKLDPGFMAGWCMLDEGKLSSREVYCLRLMAKTTRDDASEEKTKVYVESMLLLQSDDGDPEAFMRVGVCKIRTSTPWFKDCVKRSVCIR